MSAIQQNSRHEFQNYSEGYLLGALITMNSLYIYRSSGSIMNLIKISQDEIGALCNVEERTCEHVPS